GVFAVAGSPVTAQGPRMTPDRLNQLASKPTPRLGEHADLNGTWDHLGGIEFVQPRKLANGSVCIIGGPPEAGARGGGRGVPPGVSNSCSRASSRTGRYASSGVRRNPVRAAVASAVPLRVRFRST